MSLSLSFWIKFILTLPLRILFALPYWIIKPFSKNKAFRYYEKNKILQKIDEWVF